MKPRYIDVDGKWGILLYCDTRQHDMPAIAKVLRALGCPEGEIRKHRRFFRKPNRGLTFSSESLRMSVTCIGWATSLDEYVNTVIHEIDHQQDAICRCYDVPLGSEDSAYLQGYLGTKELVALFSMVCPHCGSLNCHCRPSALPHP